MSKNGLDIAQRGDSGSAVSRRMEIRFRSVSEDKKLVTGLVYAPDTLDTYCEAMRAEDIEIMAHRFMRLDLSKAIDVQHDNNPVDAHVVESFIVRHATPEYEVGAWVLSVKVEDDGIWRMIKDGKINGFSFEAMVKAVKAEVTYEVTRDCLGFTEPGEDGHRHVIYVQVGPDGNVVGGATSEVNGHSHAVTKASTTGRADGHIHKFFLG
jgi:hypothetical protein